MTNPTGPFETGAHDAATNDFILSAMNTKPLHDLLLKNFHAAEIYVVGKRDTFAHLSPESIDFVLADAYFKARKKDYEEETKS